MQQFFSYIVIQKKYAIKVATLSGLKNIYQKGLGVIFCKTTEYHMLSLESLSAFWRRVSRNMSRNSSEFL